MLKKLFTKYKSLVHNERGAQTLEWVAVAAVVVTIAALLGSAFSEGSALQNLVNSIIGKIQDSL